MCKWCWLNKLWISSTAISEKCWETEARAIHYNIIHESSGWIFLPTKIWMHVEQDQCTSDIDAINIAREHRTTMRKRSAWRCFFLCVCVCVHVWLSHIILSVMFWPIEQGSCKKIDDDVLFSDFSVVHLIKWIWSKRQHNISVSNKKKEESSNITCLYRLIQRNQQTEWKESLQPAWNSINFQMM